MDDKEAIVTSIKELGKARKEKTARLKEAVQTVSANRRIAREQPNRPA